MFIKIKIVFSQTVDRVFYLQRKLNVHEGSYLIRATLTWQVFSCFLALACFWLAFDKTDTHSNVQRSGFQTILDI